MENDVFEQHDKKTINNKKNFDKNFFTPNAPKRS